MRPAGSAATIAKAGNIRPPEAARPVRLTTTVNSSQQRPEAGLFVTTRWTEVAAARDANAPGAAAALEALCRAYWRPLYLWLRRQGRNPHDAQDLTQEFFSRLLEKDWLRAADRDKGRFRTFLLVALKRFLSDDWDRTRAQKRGGGQLAAPLDTELAEQTLASHASGPPESPDQAYERQWALTLIERVIARLREEFTAAGRTDEFDALKDFLTAGRGEIPYATVATRLNTSEGAARVAVHRIRKRFRELFREEVTATVAPGEDIDDELRQLQAALRGR